MCMFHKYNSNDYMRYSSYLRLILVDNYFLLTTFAALVLLFTGKSYVGYILTPFMLYGCAFSCKIKKSDFWMNVFFALLLLGIFLSWVINEFAYQEILIVRCLGSEVAFMMAYFIGCSLKDDEYDNLFQKCLKPVAILSVIGIYLFLFPPQWYLDRMSHLGEEEITLEDQRMKSIFSSPYILSYISCILLTYVLFRIFQYGEPFKKYRYYILLHVVTLLLCMQRAPLGGAVVGFGGAILYYAVKYQRLSVLVRSLFLSLVLLLSTYFFISNSKDERVGYLRYKIESVIYNDETDFAESRYNISYMEVRHSLLGDGAGRHAAWAGKYHSTNMPDGQYKKVMQERGDIGFAIFVIFLALVFLKCVIYVRYLCFELCIMIFLLVSMIGANPLTQIHPYLFWLIMGRVSAFRPARVKMMCRH